MFDKVQASRGSAFSMEELRTLRDQFRTLYSTQVCERFDPSTICSPLAMTVGHVIHKALR